VPTWQYPEAQKASWFLTLKCQTYNDNKAIKLGIFLNTIQWSFA
jgi:hypothetical protein